MRIALPWISVTGALVDPCNRTLTSAIPHQGSSLGPAQFISYTECSVDIFSTYGVQSHLFADDTQSYDHCPITITCTQSTLIHLSSCINDLAALFSSLRLQLNLMKSEFIWFGSRAGLAEIPSDLRSLLICVTAIDSADVVRDLGVWLDSELTMKHQYDHFRMLLSPPEVATAPRQGQPGHHQAASDLCRPK